MSVHGIRRLLAHPLTVGLDLDDPTTTELRKQVISSKPLLKSIYDDWYQMLNTGLPPGDGPVLELGSGAGYCDRVIPNLITSEIFSCPGVRLQLDAQQMPFPEASLRAIVFTGVMHHIPNVRRFLTEASRCLQVGGKIIMIEPWVTPWSRFVYTYLHHEPFDTEAKDWAFPSSGPLSDANIAIPWMVFKRDRSVFESEYPELSIEEIRPFLPFRYVLSGGLALRNVVPGFTNPLWIRLERIVEPWMESLAMYAFISVARRDR
jgi:SAM-dependent methyltransferase